tara:strand:- start:533 stop:943 length:411 start_codon:yes stop_codon:yes gene_type:complete
MFEYFKKIVKEQEQKQKADKEKDAPTGEELPAVDYGSVVSFFVEDGIAKVDILLEDYKESSIENLATILMGLVGSMFFLPTFEMVRDGLLKDDKEDVLFKIVALLDAADVFSNLSNDVSGSGDDEEEPCVTPEDAF